MEWQDISTFNDAMFSAYFGGSKWVLAATSDGRVTEAMPYFVDHGRLWVCSRGPNCSDPRWPNEYLPNTVTHWMPLPEPPEAG